MALPQPPAQRPAPPAPTPTFDFDYDSNSIPTPLFPLSPLSQLAHLITTSIHTLERICTTNNTPLPALDAPAFTRASEAFREDAGAAEAARVLAAACMQVLAVVRPPTDTLFALALGEHHSFAVRVCLEANVTEILREAGPEGLHVNDIAAQCGLDASKLGRIMRYLVIHHVYRELKPNVFTNNRVSGTMDTGKSAKEIVANPDFKYDSAQSGFAALISHHLDMDHKSSAVAWDVLKDPVLGHSNDITDTVFSRGLGLDGDTTYWKFLQHPDNAARHRRFGFAMEGMKANEPPEMILKAFDWDGLGKDSLVVDVGGGIGVTSMLLAKRYPGLSVIIQDLPPVVEEAKKYWSKTLPDDLASGRIKIEAQDFFAAQQPGRNVSAFIVKYILHNWPRPYMAKILRRLREVASRETVLIIIDNVLPYACHAPDEKPTTASSAAEQGAEKEKGMANRTQFKIAPKPLLPNYGAVGHNAYTLDLTMMMYFNAQEHTVTALTELLESTGWQLRKFRSVDPKNDFLQSVEAVPRF